MAVRGAKTGLGKYVYRLYAFGYVAVLGFGFLGDLSGTHATKATISPRTTAIAALTLTLVVLVLGMSGRRAVALRPTPAELQLAVMSPMPRRHSLARATGFGATSAAIATAVAALALMLTSARQFAGLTVAIQLGYVAFAAGVGLLVFAVHLLAAEKRFRIVFGLLIALATGAALDVAYNANHSPAAVVIESLRGGAPALAVLTPWLIGIGLLIYANLSAERLPMEMVNRGSDLADRAAIALSGNDLRSLLLLQRSIGSAAWRTRPRVRVSSRLARRSPVTSRGARSMLRWRLPRVVIILGAAAGTSALLRVRPASFRTVALSAILLWALGLAFGEPLAQEHDRSERLEMLPYPRRIEHRHVIVSWATTFVVLGIALAVALNGRVSIASTVALAVAGASAATAAGTTTYRKPWKPLVSGALAFMPEIGGVKVAFSVLWPALIAVICVSGWIATDNPLAVAVPGVVVIGLVYVWITIGQAVTASVTAVMQDALGGPPK